MCCSYHIKPSSFNPFSPRAAGSTHFIPAGFSSLSQLENTCASSTGGPGLNFGEQSAGRSMLGTRVSHRLRGKWIFSLSLPLTHPQNPHSGLTRLALRFPPLRHRPSSCLPFGPVPIHQRWQWSLGVRHGATCLYSPTLMLTSLQASIRRPSGRYPLSRKRVKYWSGWRRWNTEASDEPSPADDASPTVMAVKVVEKS